MAEARAEQLDLELEQANADLAQAREQLGHLQAMVGGEEKSSRPKQERQRVEGEGMTGIYFHETEDGPLFEISWPENGKTRWKRVGYDLDEAVALRKELTGQKVEVTA
jgi:hypothetical protein